MSRELTLDSNKAASTLNSIAGWLAREIIANEVRFDGQSAMPAGIRSWIAAWMVTEHGWPDKESAEAFLDEWDWQ